MQAHVSQSDFGGMEASLKSFCERPEVRRTIELQQQKQATRRARIDRQLQAKQFQQKVLQADEETQRNIAPFLSSKSLREIVRSLANSSNSSFEEWAKNPQVIHMLSEAQHLLHTGQVTEQQLQRSFLAHFEALDSDGSGGISHQAAAHKKRGNDQLVLALNAHLLERRQGNQHYKQKEFDAALACYYNAVSMLEPVQAFTPEEQHEVDMNLVKAYLNMAAVYLAQQCCGKAIKSCTQALNRDQHNARALLRRAKAHLGRRNYQDAIADLSCIIQLDPSDLDAHALMQEARAKECADRSNWTCQSAVQAKSDA